MSEDDDSEEGKKKPKGETREKSKTEPVPSRVDLFEWLEKHFDGDQYPERIDVRVVYGAKFKNFGPKIKEVTFLPGATKPNKERLVSYSNEFSHLAQRDCDIQRKRTVYAVNIWHLTRDDGPVERFLLDMQPGGTYAKDGTPREDDEEEDPPSMHNRFNEQILGHQEKMVGMLGAGFENIIDRDDRTIERLMQRVERLEAKLERKDEQLERALSLEQERTQQRMWMELKLKAAEKTLDMGLSLAPPLLNQLVNRQIIPTSETAETIALKNFFKLEKDGGSLTQAQSDAAFGAYAAKEPHDMIKPGALSEQQAQLLYAVAHCKIPPDELDKLMPGGPLEITMDQLGMLLQNCGFSMEQLAPLQLIFQARQKRRQG